MLGAMATHRAPNRRVITVTESIWVDASPEIVFDYTQDYTRRADWDVGVAHAVLVSSEPRSARLTMPGLGRATLVYRLDRRPERTSVAFTDIDSRWISGGGGSWEYLAEDGGTRWEQTNSLELRHPRLVRIFAGTIQRRLRESTIRSMAEAKRRIESDAIG